jgi:hypothetical protein
VLLLGNVIINESLPIFLDSAVSRAVLNNFCPTDRFIIADGRGISGGFDFHYDDWYVLSLKPRLFGINTAAYSYLRVRNN